MKVLRFIFYQPYLLLILYLILNLYFFNKQHSLGETTSMILLFCLNIFLVAFIFFKLLRNSLVRLLNQIKFLQNIPDTVLTGYLFIFTLVSPIASIIFALISKIFIKNKKEQLYIDDYGNEVSQIKSLTPTIILSRKEQKTGEEEHIVMTKLKKKPKKITYE